MAKKRKPLIFIKLGGAAITFKNFPKKANDTIIDQCAREIASLADNFKFIIGHGGGGFAHPIASRYKVKEGLKTCGIKGMVETQRAVRELNNIVVNTLMDRGVPVSPVLISSSVIANNGQIKEFYLKPLKELLGNGLVPVINGDVVMDATLGCSIASTEMLFSFLISKIKPKRIVVGTDVDGIYITGKNKNEQLVPEISRKNFDSIIKKIGSSKYTDVTGGMKSKVSELYKIARKGIDIQIINLLREGNLSAAIRGEHIGTIIK